MTFTSWIFLPYFIVVYSGYLLLQGRLRWQNRWLLVASLFFYGWWDWRFLSLMVATATVDFFAARRRLLWLSVGLNLGCLGVFKYYNLFAATVGLPLSGLILPIGISFYTFHAMSYVIDVCRGAVAPAGEFEDFLLFMCFFPQMVAGPIARAGSLLPQIQNPRRLEPDRVETGLTLVLWGFFQKVVVADHLARLSDLIFSHQTMVGRLDLPLGGFSFFLQLYSDFAGYSNIARGLARLMGFELLENFKTPLFASSRADFWRRWHISLSTWIRDYVYIPLGGSTGSGAAMAARLLLTMTLCGLWHGAAWHYAAWGLLEGFLLVSERIVWPASILGGGALTALASAATFTVFRAPDLGQAAEMLMRWGFAPSTQTAAFGRYLCFYAGPLVAWDLIEEKVISSPRARPALWAGLAACILAFGARDVRSFIYFQF